jgi:hypothetical protein
MLKRTLLILAFCLLAMPICYADTKEIIAEGTYNMGDGETPQVAEERALTQAKQSAIEQAGTYIESYSETNNLQLVKDEVKIISSGVMNTTVIDQSRTIQEGGSIQFWVKIKATVSTDNIKDMAVRLRQLSSTPEYNQIQETCNNLNTQNSTQPEINAANEKEWLANHWLNVGMNQYLLRDYPGAIASFGKSYSINQNATSAELIASVCYEMKLPGKSIAWYATRHYNAHNFGNIYKKLGRCFNKLYVFLLHHG